VCLGWVYQPLRSQGLATLASQAVIGQADDAVADTNLDRDDPGVTRSDRARLVLQGRLDLEQCARVGRVLLFVRVVGLLRGESVAEVRLSRTVLGPLAGTEEGRDRDSDQDGDDEDNDHQLDEGETFLILAEPLPQRLEHFDGLLLRNGSVANQ